MSMSRKHYVAIARAVDLADNKVDVAYNLASIFANDNPRFDRARFLEACGVLGYRTCDTCDRITDAGEFPDWVNGQCEQCDPSILDLEENIR